MSKSIMRKLTALAVVGAMAMPMAGFAQDNPVVISENEQVVISEKEDVNVEEDIDADVEEDVDVEDQEDVDVDLEESEKEENEMIKTEGTISEFTNQDGDISVLVEIEDDEYGMVFHISEDVVLWDRTTEEVVTSDSLEEGMKLEVFYNKNTPMLQSLPAQLTPGVVVIQGETNMPTYLGEFNEELISVENFLQLNIEEDTVIVNEKGEALEAEDIAGKTVLVFYTMSTKSIPAQTTPSKVVVLAEKEIEEDTDVEEEEVKEMIALRAAATDLGYKVVWDHDDRTVEMTKENQTIVIKLDSVDYTLNKSLGKFSKAPELREGTTYVSVSVLDFMN